MRKILYLFPIFLLAISCTKAEKPEPNVRVLDWKTEAGIQRLERSKFKADFFPLANHYESQTDKMLCGPVSGAMVLNAMRLFVENFPKPMDKSYFKAKNGRHLPEGYEVRIKRYTPQTFLNAKNQKIKSWAQLYGQPIKGKKDFGIQLRQLQQMFVNHGTKAEIRVVDDSLSEDAVRRELKENMGRSNDFVVVNFNRKVLEQPGSGHISPLGAYDEKSDSFLMLDVNPTYAPWSWVTTKALVEAMKTFDTIENRGYLLISEATVPYSEDKKEEK